MNYFMRDGSKLNVPKRPALQPRMVEPFGYNNNKWDVNYNIYIGVCCFCSVYVYKFSYVSFARKKRPKRRR